MIENFADVKCVTQLKLNWQLQCNAVQLSYSHLHVITIVEMHSTVRIENIIVRSSIVFHRNFRFDI